MVIKSGDTVITESGMVGIVTLANNYAATKEIEGSAAGSVISVKMAHDPADTKIYILESEQYNFSLNSVDNIKTISRKKKVILDFCPGSSIG